MTNQKMIFCLTAFLSTFNVAHAMDIKNGTLINSRVWNTGQFTSSFLDAKSPPKHASIINAINKMHPSISPEFIEATNNLDNTQLTGTTTAPTTIGSSNNMTIINTSSTSQTYNITTKVCVQGTSFPVQCANDYDEIQLDPQGTATLSRLPTMNITLSDAGNYITTAGVEVVRGDLDMQYFTTGDLTIT
jgi:hypothetical protein